MDHTINALREQYQIELVAVAEELNSGRYRSLTDCPSYKASKALVDAIHTLERYYYGSPKTDDVRRTMSFWGVL